MAIYKCCSCFSPEKLACCILVMKLLFTYLTEENQNIKQINVEIIHMWFILMCLVENENAALEMATMNQANSQYV